MRIYIVVLGLCLSTTFAFSQQRYEILNASLIYGDYNCGIPLSDTSKVLIMNITTSSYNDSVKIVFDDKGRIEYTTTKFETCSYSYAKNKVIKTVSSTLPSRLFDCNAFKVTFYLKDGKIDHSQVDCELATFQLQYLYSSCDDVVSVKIMNDGGKVIENNVFLFDSENSFKWETINPFGGIALNYYCFYQTNEYTSNLFFDTSVQYVTIKNEVKTKNRTQQIKDKFTIYELNGNEYGLINITRLPANR